jgi:hypothetical protein
MRVAHEDNRSILALDREPVAWGARGARGFGWEVGQLPDAGTPIGDWRAAASAGMAGLVIEGRRRHLHSSIDGTASLYWLEDGGATYFCSRIEPLARSAGKRLSIDWEAWAAILALRYPVGDRTPFAELRRLPRFSTLSMPRLGKTRVSSATWPWSEIEPSIGLEEAAERVVAALRASLAPLPGGIPCPLSGGRDSRILFLALAADGRAGTALTVSDDEGDTYEEDLAAAVATASGVPHQRLAGEEAAYPADWQERARRVEFQFADHAWLTPVAQRVEGSAVPIPDGFAIDVSFCAGRHFYTDETLDLSDGRKAGEALFKTLRRYGKGERALSAELAGSIEASSREQFRAATRDFEGHPSQPILSLYATRSERGVATYPTGLLGHGATVLTPGCSDDLVRAALAVDPQDKLGGGLYAAVLRRLAPAGGLPSTADTPRKPPHLARRWRSETAIGAWRQRLDDGPLTPFVAPGLKDWLADPRRGELSPDLRLGSEAIGLLHAFCDNYRDVLRDPDPSDLLG